MHVCPCKLEGKGKNLAGKPESNFKQYLQERREECLLKIANRAILMTGACQLSSLLVLRSECHNPWGEWNLIILYCLMLLLSRKIDIPGPDCANESRFSVHAAVLHLLGCLTMDALSWVKQNVFQSNSRRPHCDLFHYEHQESFLSLKQGTSGLWEKFIAL